MPVCEGVYKCNYCEDEFRVNDKQITKCKCGKTEIQISRYGYSYAKRSSVTEIEHNFYYIKDDFTKFTEDEQGIYNKIKEIKEKNGYKYFLYEGFERGKNNEKYLSDVVFDRSDYNGNNDTEANKIEMRLSLRKNDYKYNKNRILEKLTKLLEVVELIENDKDFLKTRKRLLEFQAENDLYYTEEPTGDTNVTVYI